MMKDHLQMVIYEVNLTINLEISEEFTKWLYRHIDEILKIDGFEKATWFEREPLEDDEKNKTLWTIHYQLKDRESLQNYFDQHAARLRQDGMDRFGSQFSASRRILKVRDL